MRASAPSAPAHARPACSASRRRSRAPLTAQAVYDVALSEGRELLGADAGMVALPVEQRSAVEMVATFGFTEEETVRLAPLPALAAHADRRGHRERPTGLPRRGRAREPLPRRAAAAELRLPRCRCESATRRSARWASASSAVTSSTTPSASSRPRMGEQCAYALERARVYDAERRARGALGLLAAIGEQLARSLEPDAALRTLADLVVPSLADQCIVDIVVGDAVRRLVVVNADPEVQEAALVLERYPPILTSDTPVAVAIRTGQPQVVAVDRGAARQRLSQCRAPRRRRARRHPHDALDAAARARPDARRSHVRMADARRFRTRTRSSSPGRSPAASALALDNSALYQEAHGERERLAALVRQLPLGVIIAESSSRKLLFTNQRAQELLGHGASERSIAGPHAELVHRALEGESTTDSEIDVVRADGSHGIVSLSAEPVRDAGGEIVAAVATLFDLTEHRQREEALAFLAEASVVLTETLDLQHTLTELVELAVPRLADWCTIDMLERGEIRNVGVAHADPETARLARRVHERRPVRAQASSGVSAALAHRPLAAHPRRPGLAGRAGDARRGAARRCRACSACARRSWPRSRAAGACSARSRSPRRSPAGTSRSRTWRSPKTWRGAPHWRSTTPGSTAPSTTSRTPCSRACCRARSRSRPAPRSPRATARPARVPRWAATSTTRWQTGDIYFLAIGDVAGHGPAAAALTSLTRQTMRVVSRYEPSPGRILAVVNDTIRAQSEPEQFCTAALASLRPTEGGYSLTVACAGHPPPVDRARRRRAPRRSASAAPCSAWSPSASTTSSECVLGLGDLVAFWTDGVTERRHDGGMFGEQRLLSLLGGAADRPAAEVAREIDEAVVDFAPGLPHDDVAILIGSA